MPFIFFKELIVFVMWLRPDLPNLLNELSYCNIQHALADKDDVFFSSFLRGPLPKDGNGVCFRRNQVLLEEWVSYEQ